MFFLLEKHENLLRGVEKANPRGMSQSYRQPKTIELPPFRGEKLPSQPQKSGRYVPVAFQPLKTPSLPFVVWQKLNGHWADHDYDYNFLFFLLSYILHFPIISWFWHSILQHAQGNVFDNLKQKQVCEVPISFARGIVMVSPKMCSGQPLQGKTHIYIYIYDRLNPKLSLFNPRWCVHEISANHA